MTSWHEAHVILEPTCAHDLWRSCGPGIEEGRGVALELLEVLRKLVWGLTEPFFGQGPVVRLVAKLDRHNVLHVHIPAARAVKRRPLGTRA